MDGFRRPFGPACAVAVLAALVVGGCGGGDEQPAATTATTAASPASTTTTTVAASTGVPAGMPSPEELAAGLVTADDLTGDWSVSSDLESLGVVPGVVTDETRAQLPSLEVCPEGGEEAAAAAASVTWHAFTVLETPGAENPITLGEFLSAGDPGDVGEMFGELLSGMVRCAGTEPVDGGTEAAEVISLPDLGDDRLGVRVVTTGSGPASYLWAAFVRDGGVFMFLDVWEVTNGEPRITEAGFLALVTAAAGKLP